MLDVDSDVEWIPTENAAMQDENTAEGEKLRSQSWTISSVLAVFHWTMTTQLAIWIRSGWRRPILLCRIRRVMTSTLRRNTVSSQEQSPLVVVVGRCRVGSATYSLINLIKR